MPEYRIVWEIDVIGETPQDAAENAEVYMRERGARTYVVREWKFDLNIEGPYLGEPVTVDLDEEVDDGSAPPF